MKVLEAISHAENEVKETKVALKKSEEQVGSAKVIPPIDSQI